MEKLPDYLRLQITAVHTCALLSFCLPLNTTRSSANWLIFNPDIL